MDSPQSNLSFVEWQVANFPKMEIICKISLMHSNPNDSNPPWLERSLILKEICYLINRKKIWFCSHDQSSFRLSITPLKKLIFRLRDKLHCGLRSRHYIFGRVNRLGITCLVCHQVIKLPGEEQSWKTWVSYCQLQFHEPLYVPNIIIDSFDLLQWKLCKWRIFKWRLHVSPISENRCAPFS